MDDQIEKLVLNLSLEIEIHTKVQGRAEVID